MKIMSGEGWVLEEGTGDLPMMTSEKSLAKVFGSITEAVAVQRRMREAGLQAILVADKHKNRQSCSHFTLGVIEGEAVRNRLYPGGRSPEFQLPCKKC